MGKQQAMLGKKIAQAIRELPLDYLMVLWDVVERFSGKNRELWLERMRKFLRGGYDMSNEHVVDCDVMPEILFRKDKDEHRKMGKMLLEKRNGKLYANGREVIRHLLENQQERKGYKSYQEMSQKTVLNLCILDYLLKHPELIPEEWKKGETYFLGTIFRDSNGFRSVAYLTWYGSTWGWCFCLFDCNRNDGTEYVAYLEAA